ncbi:30S ribosomal protein S1 [Deltaproteobacteria bacterium]|nr:30S ribosomal protein S1 [Deltaproteobacteria bacterium]
MEQEHNDIAEENVLEESFEELLKRSNFKMVNLTPGEEVEAVIIKISKEWVFIDTGGKSEGYIVIDEFMDDDGKIAINEGDRIKVYFLSAENNERLFTTRLTVDAKGKGLLEEAFYNRIPVEGFVEKEIKGGFEIRIAGNIRSFCPYSQMGLRGTENADKHIGTQLTFKIIEYGEKGRNLVVSNRAVLEDERQKQKEALRQSLKEGMTIEGEITSIREFGAFVDIGGIEGLIHISEISWDRVEDIDSVLSVGQRVDVSIMKLDWENDKFSFSLKEILPDPWTGIGERYPEGSIYTGKISRITPFGAFVNLGPGVDGLIHISEIGKGKKIKHPREVLAEGQTVEVKIGRVDEEKRRLSLAMVLDSQDSETDFKKYITEGGNRTSSGSLGKLGDLLMAKLEKDKK